jgi:G patch domain/KOW motif-containing protein
MVANSPLSFFEKSAEGMQFQFAAPAAAPLLPRGEGARDASGDFKAKEEPAAPRVIPLPEALRNRSLPQDPPVPEKPKSKAPSQQVSYQPGLQFVGRSAAKKLVEGAPAAAAPGERPMLMMNAVPGLAEIVDEREKFQKDLESRPEDVEQTAYEEMPVEEFGKALLRGMGWKEGEGIGKSNKVDAPVIQYIPRPERLGLGAAPKKVEEPPPSASKKRRIAKPGEEPNRKEQEYELNVTADGKVKHTVTIDQGLVVKAKLELRQGALVGIVDGVHEGLLGRVTRTAFDRSSVTVRLGSAEEVTVKTAETVLLDQALLQRKNGMEEVKRIMGAARKELRNPVKNESGKREAQVRVEEDDCDDKKKKRKKKGKKEKKTRKAATWLVPGIVVRCVSKTFQGGKLYQKKLLITDLVTVDVASAVLLDDRNKLVEQVTKDLVETALPQVGGTVKVVRGSHAGELATLQQRDSEKNRAVIQMEEDGTIETCAMDDVAQFVGIK